MRHKWLLGFFLLTFSIILTLSSLIPTITGGAIGVINRFSSFYVISLVFFIFSLLIFASTQTLDAIMIPTGNYDADAKRTKRGYEEGKEKPGQMYLISGRIDQPVKTSQVYAIYKQLRGYGVRPGNIRIEGKSASTLENVLFSLEKFKQMGAHDVGIASAPTHLDRFEDLIKEAKKEGLIDNNFRVHRLETSESLKEWAYGVAHRAFYRYELAHGGLKAVGEASGNKSLRVIKKGVNKIIDKILPEK